MTTPALDVWTDLIGQERLVATLQRAVAATRSEQGRHAMTHAWLFTGPPGSGRSNAARAFAAALQCDQGGCGLCNTCVTTLSGAHPDVTLVRTEKLSIGIDEIRELVRRAAMSPTTGRFQILVVEDADRITERGADALLKSIEEPAPRTVWMLCAPTAQDVVATVRSRCREVNLRTPPTAAIAELLHRRDGIDLAQAQAAARVAQGHIGRARVLARSEAARARRLEILGLPVRLGSVGACLAAAAETVQAATEEANQVTAELDAQEREELSRALGFTTKGARPRNAQTALRELEDQQKARSKRLLRDALDRVLAELTGFYRDVLVVQQHQAAPVTNSEVEDRISWVAQRTTPTTTMRNLDAITGCRVALETNVAPLLALEALMLSLGGQG